MQHKESAEVKDQWTVIVNKSLTDSEVHRLLKSQHRIRVSTGTLANTCIYPQSSVAFMIVTVDDALTSWPPRETCEVDPAFTQRLLQFTKLHHKCYVLLCAPMLGSNEQKVLAALQEHFLTSGLHFLPVHNASECVENMLTIAKVTCKPLSAVIMERLERVQQQLVSEEVVVRIIERIGLREFETLLLMDGCGQLASIAQLSADELAELSLDGPAIQRVLGFLHEKGSSSTSK